MVYKYKHILYYSCYNNLFYDVIMYFIIANSHYLYHKATVFCKLQQKSARNLKVAK